VSNKRREKRPVPTAALNGCGQTIGCKMAGAASVFFGADELENRLAIVGQPIQTLKT
jgi:hypothetical protein